MADSSRKGDILKVRLGDDIRRMVLYNTHISYDDLVLMLQRVYNGKLKSSDDVALKYYDEDNDLITIADDSDFAHAREYAQRGVVKMIVYVNGCDRFVDTKQLQGIRRELTDVRNKVNSLVDALDSASVVDDLASNTARAVAQDSNTGWAKNDEQKIPPQAASMFDPLTTSTAQTSTDLSVFSSSAAVTTTVSTIPGAVSSTHVDYTSTAAGQSEGGASHLFAGNQDGSSLLLQTSQPQPLPQSQVHEKYAGITVSLLRGGQEGKDQQSSATSHPGGGAQGGSPSHKTATPQMTGGGAVGGKTSEGTNKKRVKIIPEPLQIREMPLEMDMKVTTPHEVLQRQMTSVEQRLNASREVRRQHPVMATRSFSPLSPLIRRMNSLENVQPQQLQQVIMERPHIVKGAMKKSNERRISGQRVTFSTIPEYVEHPNSLSNNSTENSKEKSENLGEGLDDSSTGGRDSLPQNTVPSSHHSISS